MRRPLAPTLPESSGAPDPVKEMAARQKAAIASRVKGFERQQVSDAGVDSSAQPKPSRTGSPDRSASSSKKDSPASKAAEPAAKSTASQPSSEASPKTGSNSSDPSPATPTSSEAATTSEESGTQPATSATPAATETRYDDIKAFKKWAEKNPEAALKFAEEVKLDVFRDGEDPKTEWVRQTNKGRKLKEEIRSERAENERKNAAEIAQAKEFHAKAEQIAGEIRYLSGMWAAANGKDQAGNRVVDFDSVDEAFRQNSGGLTIDEYNRMRARRGVSNPETARLRAENAQLKGRLQAPAQQTNGAAAAADPKGQGQPAAQAPAAAPAAPGRNPEEFWGDEVPKSHGLRKFAGWAKDLDTEMQRFHDDTLDEYSRDAEQIADQLLQRKLAELRGEDEDEAPPAKAPRVKPKTPKNRTAAAAPKTESGPPVSVPGLPYGADKLTPRGAVNTDRSVIEGHYNGTEPPGMANREKWALERARARARGEQVD